MRGVRRPGTPKQFRILLFAFLIRHLVSLGVLAFLTFMAYRTGGTFVYVMAAISLAFLGFASFQARQILGQYRRSRQRADEIARREGN